MHQRVCIQFNTDSQPIHASKKRAVSPSECMKTHSNLISFSSDRFDLEGASATGLLHSPASHMHSEEAATLASSSTSPSPELEIHSNSDHSELLDSDDISNSGQPGEQLIPEVEADSDVSDHVGPISKDVLEFLSTIQYPSKLTLEHYQKITNLQKLCQKLF